MPDFRRSLEDCPHDFIDRTARPDTIVCRRCQTLFNAFVEEKPETHADDLDESVVRRIRLQAFELSILLRAAALRGIYMTVDTVEREAAPLSGMSHTEVRVRVDRESYIEALIQSQELSRLEAELKADEAGI